MGKTVIAKHDPNVLRLCKLAYGPADPAEDDGRTTVAHDLVFTVSPERRRELAITRAEVRQRLFGDLPQEPGNRDDIA